MKKQVVTKIIKKYFTEFMGENNFRIYGGDLIIRLTDNIVQGVYFQPSAHSEKINITIFIQPLFVQRETIALSPLGNRWGQIQGRGDYWINVDTEENIESAVKEIKLFLDKYALTWFAMTRSSKDIIENYEKSDHPAFPKTDISGDITHDLGYYACECERFDKAEDYLKKAITIFKKQLSGFKKPPEVHLKRQKDMETLLENLDNPQKIRKILDKNIQYTRKNLKIELKPKDVP